jgi:Domain of unknown function (DUF4157)
MRLQRDQHFDSTRTPAAEQPRRRPEMQRWADSPRMVAQRQQLERCFGPVIQRKNDTGLPDQLKSGLEALSGHDLSEVRVHRNSSHPAQLNALAFTQGSQIHLAPGQEKHLAHEAWHVVQQRRGQVQPTMSVAGVAINDDPGLENEADVMGRKAQSQHVQLSSPPPLQTPANSSQTATTQRKIGFEFETGVPVRIQGARGAPYPMGYQDRVFTGGNGLWKVVADSSHMEFVTEPFDETPAGRAQLVATMTAITTWASAIPAVVNAANANGQPRTGRVAHVRPASGTSGDAGWWLASILIDLPTMTVANLECAPQATAGVRLERIPALVHAMLNTNIVAHEPQQTGGLMQILAAATPGQIRALGLTPAQQAAWLGTRTRLNKYQAQTGVTPQNWATSLVGMDVDHARFLAKARTSAMTAVNAHVAVLPPPAPNFDKLTGLLTLIISYLEAGHRTHGVMAYSKLIAPLMARTDFYTLHANLRPHEQALFTPAFVLAAAGMAGTQNTHIYTAGFQDGANVNHGPTRGEWLDSIAHGSPGTLFGRLWRKPVDLLSHDSGSRAAANSSSLGTMHQMDRRVTGQQDLAVLELRRLPKRVHLNEWLPMARVIFNAIMHLPP